MARETTRERVLDAAEVLFAAHGVAGTSIRAITRAAGVNLAAVHYHFGGKDELLEAVLARRIAPVNQERLKLLERVAAADAAGTLSVRTILHALLWPVLRMLEEEPDAVQRLARLLSRAQLEEPDVTSDRVHRHFAEVGEAFGQALLRALPELAPEEVHARLRWVIGVLIHELAWRHVPDGFALPDVADTPSRRMERMLRFLDAGLRAPGTPDEESRDAS